MDRKLVLFRHGESIGNIDPKMFSNDDYNFLTMKGVEQAINSATAISKLKFQIDFWLTSPLLRARQTLFYMTQELNGTPIIPNAMIPEFQERIIGFVNYRKNPRNHESDKEFSLRISNANNRILLPWLKKGNVFLSVHSYVITKMFELYKLPFPSSDGVDKSIKVKHCTPYIIDVHIPENINNKLRPK